MPDEVSEAVEELRRQREALRSEREVFFTRIAGPLDRLSELAGKPKRDARALVEEKRREAAPTAASSDVDDPTRGGDETPPSHTEPPGRTAPLR